MNVLPKLTLCGVNYICTLQNLSTANDMYVFFLKNVS